MLKLEYSFFLKYRKCCCCSVLYRFIATLTCCVSCFVFFISSINLSGGICLDARLKSIPLKRFAWEETVFTLLFSLTHASSTRLYPTSAVEATTCGSTQAVLMKEPRGQAL